MMTSKVQLRLMIFEKLFDALHDIVVEMVNCSGVDIESSTKVTDVLATLKDMLSITSKTTTAELPSNNKKISKASSSKGKEVVPSSRLNRALKRSAVPTEENENPKRGKTEHENSDETPAPPILINENEDILPSPISTEEIPDPSDSVVAQVVSQPLNPRNKRLALAPRRKTIFLSGLAKENNVEDIKEYVSEILGASEGCNDILIFKISPKTSCNHASFKIFCPDLVFETLLDAFRKDGMNAREFHDQKKATHQIPKNLIASPPSIKT